MLLKYVWSISAKKISFIRTCDREEIKATDCIIKVFITRGNIKWRSFALRFCASNHKSAWQPLLPSMKGLSFILSYTFIQESCWSSPFLFTFYPVTSTMCWRDPNIYKYIWSISTKKIIFIQTCDREEIKATDCIVKSLSQPTI